MQLLNAVSVVVLVAVLVQLGPAGGASTRHQHHRRAGGGGHYRGYRQDPAETAVAAAANVEDDSTTSRWPSNCSHCSARQAKRDYRLASIKTEILRKLHLRAPPNISRGRQLPNIPPLRDLIGDDMVSDAPAADQGHADDDYHSTTVKMMLFPIAGTTPHTAADPRCG